MQVEKLKENVSVEKSSCAKAYVLGIEKKYSAVGLDGSGKDGKMIRRDALLGVGKLEISRREPATPKENLHGSRFHSEGIR